jgi:hypothetical protein
MIKLNSLCRAARAAMWSAAAFATLVLPSTAAAQLVTGLQGASGSAIGPGGALYVTEGAAGRISRVDPVSGEVTTLASGLPPSLIGIGGAIDVAFIGSTAYALVTLVGPDVGGSDVVGIYRVDGPDSFTVIADIGAFNLAHPPDTDFFVPTGVQYSIQTYRDGFLVADGHMNRILHVTRDGDISVFKAFGNIVPTGLAVRGDKVYMAAAGPVPHNPEDGVVISIDARSRGTAEIASGAPLLVDVEFGRGDALYALAQGIWTGPDEGFPADPVTGSLVRVNANGTFSVLATALNIPTSFEYIGNSWYVVTLTGDVWVIPDTSGPPFGKP